MSGRTIETNLRDKIYAMLVYAEVVEISWEKKRKLFNVGTGKYIIKWVNTLIVMKVLDYLAAIQSERLCNILKIKSPLWVYNNYTKKGYTEKYFAWEWLFFFS